MRAALIGLGMVSGTFADAIARSDKVSLLKVFARSQDRRTAFLEAHPHLNATEAPSVEAIATDPEIDFVIVATPPNAREDIVAALAGAGKPILMEKPVERTLVAATDLVERCATAGVPLGIVLQHRARPVVADLRAQMPKLGALYSVEVNVPWWRPQSYYDEPGRGTYARDGGGVLLSQAIHTLDLMLTLTGPVEKVTAMAGTTGFHAMEAEDFVTAGMRFANGAFGQLFATTASFPGRGETIELHFAQGSARLDAGSLTLTDSTGEVRTFGQSAASGAGADPMAFTSDWHRAIIEDFAVAVATGRPPLVPGDEALAVHRLISALETSASQGRAVRCDHP